MKAQLVSASPGLPRDDFVVHPIGSVQASHRAAESVLPGMVGDRVADGSLADDCYPRSRVYAGTFGDSWIVASDHDSLLHWEPIPTDHGRNGFRVVMHSVVSMAGFTYWGADGSFREFMGSWDDGAAIDGGDHLPFEEPFWAGQLDPDGEARAVPGSDMPFDPMDLGEQALREFFGFVGEGQPTESDIDAFGIVIHGFDLDPAVRPAKVTVPARRSTGFLTRLLGGSR